MIGMSFIILGVIACGLLTVAVIGVVWVLARERGSGDSRKQ